MNSKIMDLATLLLQRNPYVANNPQSQSYLNLLRSGDDERIKQVANNICMSYGVTPQEAGNQALKYFGLVGGYNVQ